MLFLRVLFFRLIICFIFWIILGRERGSWEGGFGRIVMERLDEKRERRRWRRGERKGES